MNRSHLLIAASMLVLTGTLGLGQSQNNLTADTFASLRLRPLGPTLKTGRVADFQVDPSNSSIYYVVTAAGGVCRSENRGNTSPSLFDNAGSFDMCCMLIDPKDAKILWVDTGEDSNPPSAMSGDGVFKSTDSGKSWKRVGLENYEHIGNMQMDPRNPQVVYVAAQGPLWSAGGDRGIYKTTDGGATWKQMLNPGI